MSVGLVVHILLTTVALPTNERAVGRAVTPWTVLLSHPVKPLLKPLV